MALYGQRDDVGSEAVRLPLWMILECVVVWMDELRWQSLSFLLRLRNHRRRETSSRHTDQTREAEGLDE